MYCVQEMFYRFDQNGWTAVFYAAKQGYITIVQLLMDHGVDLKLKDKVCA